MVIGDCSKKGEEKRDRITSLNYERIKCDRSMIGRDPRSNWSFPAQQSPPPQTSDPCSRPPG